VPITVKELKILQNNLTKTKNYNEILERPLIFNLSDCVDGLSSLLLLPELARWLQWQGKLTVQRGRLRTYFRGDFDTTS
jgi:hypothetical protein